MKTAFVSGTAHIIAVTQRSRKSDMHTLIIILAVLAGIVIGGIGMTLFILYKVARGIKDALGHK